MPGWITHSAVSYILYRGTRKPPVDFRLMFIGALLPDLFRPLYIILLDFLNMPGGFVISYLEPFHTPFLVLLQALIISLFCIHTRSAFLTISLFAILHLLLDALIMNYGMYDLLLYPIYLGPSLPKIIPFNSVWLIIIPVMLLPLFVLIYKEQQPLSLFTFSWKRALIAFPICILLFTLPLIFQERVYESGMHYLEFFENPAAYEGKEVAFCISKVQRTNPILIDEMGQQFQLETKTNYGLVKGSVVSLRGIYTNERVIVEELLVFHPLYKNMYSLFVLGFLIALFLKRPRKSPSAR